MKAAKIKSFLDKDISDYLKKYKIPFLVIIIFMLLACVGLIATYAFYQVRITSPIIGGSTSKIADLDVRVMAEKRDELGNGIATYELYPYIPKAGYTFNRTKSYCENGSAITFYTDLLYADIDAYEHDVCYLYFDSTAQLDVTLNVYVEDVNSDGVGTGQYTKLNTVNIPVIGYRLNSKKTTCKNGSAIKYDEDSNEFIINSKNKDVCDAYMDAIDVDVNIKLFLQSKKNSKTYYEAKSIPSNSYYVLNDKTSCTSGASVGVLNQKIVIRATNKSSCVVYLDVGDGPILESMKVLRNGNSATVSLTNSDISTTPVKYYYSKDNGITFVESSNSSYTFNELGDANYEFVAYSVDQNNNSSRLKQTSTYDYYSLIDFRNQIQEKVIDVSGNYKLEVWGAQGGSYDSYVGGYGAYSSGTIYLEAGTKLYIAVGGTSLDACNIQYCSGGYNGGGRGAGSDHPVYSTGGGGATHIAKVSGLLKDFASDVSNLLIVAGGGGGVSYQVSGSAVYSGNGGSGGGYVGSSGTSTMSGFDPGKGGTQESGGVGSVGNLVNNTARGSDGSFGLGGDGNYYSAGGGAGFYGGGASNQSGAGGGSGYIANSLLIDKVMYCYNCTINNDVNYKTISTSCHSNVASDGCSKEGNGFAVISYIG